MYRRPPKSRLAYTSCPTPWHCRSAYHAVVVKSVEHDLAVAQALGFDHPVQRAPAGRAHPVRIARVAAHPPVPVRVALRVDADHHALHAERVGPFADQGRPLDPPGVDSPLVGTGLHHPHPPRTQVAAPAPAQTAFVPPQPPPPTNPAT